MYPLSQTLSLMAPSFGAAALSLRSAPTEADLKLKAEQQRKYVKDLWIFLACVIAFLTVIRILRLFLAFVIRPRSAKPTSSEKGSAETVQAGRNGRVSFRRVPTALASAFRIVAFRLSIPVGPGSVASVAELLFIFGYIAVMLILLLINSRHIKLLYCSQYN